MAEFEYSHDKHVLGTDWKSRVRDKEDLKITAYHEAGHTLVRLPLKYLSAPTRRFLVLTFASNPAVRYLTRALEIFTGSFSAETNKPEVKLGFCSP